MCILEVIIVSLRTIQVNRIFLVDSFHGIFPMISLSLIHLSHRMGAPYSAFMDRNDKI